MDLSYKDICDSLLPKCFGFTMRQVTTDSATLSNKRVEINFHFIDKTLYKETCRYSGIPHNMDWYWQGKVVNNYPKYNAVAMGNWRHLGEVVG